MNLDRETIARAVLQALEEDLGREGDITSEAVILEEQTARAVIVSRSEGVIAGVPVAKEVFSRCGARLRAQVADGDRVTAGQTVAVVGGALRSILAAERTALNFLGRLSGVATQTARFVEAVGGLVEVRDTRKTTPGLRRLEKYAAEVGGARPHRVGLFDGLFIKDNHVAAAGGVAEAIARARAARPGVPMIVEVETAADALVAAEAGAEEVLLDNMTIEELRESARLVGGRAHLEASGGVTLENARAVAETGVDSLSTGAITHAAPWLDLALEIEDDVPLPEEA